MSSRLPADDRYKCLLSYTTDTRALVGDAKLELEFNDLNPRNPVLLVKLHDILFQSNKNVSSGELLELLT